MDELTIATQAGQVRGSREGGVNRWLGIPYASASRFAAPEPVAPWSGIRDASSHGPQCPQMYGNSAKRARAAAPDFSEDCLTLNIYAPDRNDGDGDGGKPVYVWIHGGAFVAGSGNPYDGTELARNGDIIVVTINYRIGVFGFVNFGDAFPGSGIPSNLGLRDQIAALEWVRGNIAAFGGDPSRVTIGGQSAGSMSVSLLLHTQRAWPLFHGAIMQSGAVSLIHSRQKSEDIARQYVRALGLGDDPAALRSMDIARLFSAQAAVGAANPGTIPAAPWFDGDLIPASLDEIHAAQAAPVPLIAGATRDEIRLFELMPGDILPTAWPVIEDMLHDQLGPDHAQRVLAAYPRTKAGRRALATDLTFAMPTRHFADRHARHSPTWFYRFDYSHPIAGATHGLDLTLTWPMHGIRAALARGGRMAGRRADLGARMAGHYAHFVRHGHVADGWPSYRPEQRPVKVFDLADHVEPALEEERWLAWAGRDVGAGL